MTTTIPTVLVRHYVDGLPDDQGGIPAGYAVVVRRHGRAGAAVAVGLSHRCGAEHVAAEIRGAIADAIVATRDQLGAFTS